MGLEPGTLAGLLLLAAWVAADTTAAGQFMVSQPIVAGWLAGLLVGQPLLGLFMGTALQLLWSRLAPVGAAAYPESGTATVAGVAVTGAWLSGSAAWAPLTVARFPGGAEALPVLGGLAVALLAGRAGQALTIAMRTANAGLGAAADRAAASGSFSALERAHLAGLVRAAAAGVLLVGACLALVLPLVSLAGRFLPGPGTAAPAPGAPWPAANPGPALFWWLGLAAAGTVVWRGGWADRLLLLGGLALGLLLVTLA